MTIVAAIELQALRASSSCPSGACRPRLLRSGALRTSHAPVRARERAASRTKCVCVAVKGAVLKPTRTKQRRRVRQDAAALRAYNS